MILTGTEIEKIYKYAKEHGLDKEYVLGNPIACKDNIGYKQYISTKGKNKCNIADYKKF